jgi:signal transduction histidine kinase
MEAIGQFASDVAHDFNNLLTTVIGNLDRIALHRQATPEVRRFADKALRAAERGTNLTARLLAVARRCTRRPCKSTVSSMRYCPCSRMPSAKRLTCPAT